MDPCCAPGKGFTDGRLDEVHIEVLVRVLRDAEMLKIATRIGREHWVIRPTFIIAMKFLLSLHDLATESLCEEDLTAVPLTDEVTEVLRLFVVHGFLDVTFHPLRFKWSDRCE